MFFSIFLAYIKKKQYLCAMIHLLADYIFSDSLRYEGHKLIYAPAGSNPTELSGILAASIAAALLSVADEGEARGITLDTPEGRNDFFVRYEKEVLADNGSSSAERRCIPSQDKR